MAAKKTGGGGQAGGAPGGDRWFGSFYEQWEQNMAAWWDRVLDAPEVLKAMNGTLAGQVEARKAWHDAGQKWMERLNLPTRADLTRMVTIATLLEERLLALEDRLLDMQDRIANAEKEAIRARIEAVETRVTLEERLAALEARLADPTPTPTPAAPPRRRKGG